MPRKKKKMSTPAMRMRRRRQQLELDQLINDLREKSRKLGAAANNLIYLEDNPVPIEVEIIKNVSNGIKGVISNNEDLMINENAPLSQGATNLLIEAKKLIGETERAPLNYVTITDVVTKAISLMDIVDPTTSNFYIVPIDDASFPIFYEDEYALIQQIQDNPQMYDPNMRWTDCIKQYQKRHHEAISQKGKSKRREAFAQASQALYVPEVDAGNSLEMHLDEEWVPPQASKFDSELPEEPVTNWQNSLAIHDELSNVESQLNQGVLQNNDETNDDVQCAQVMVFDYELPENDDQQSSSSSSTDQMETESDEEFALFLRSRSSFAPKSGDQDELLPEVNEDDMDTRSIYLSDGDEPANELIERNDLEISIASSTSQHEDELPEEAVFDDTALCNAFSSMSIRKFSLTELIRAQQEEDALDDLLARNDRCAQRFLSIVSRHCISNEAADDLWNFVRAMNIDRKMKCFKTIYNRIKEHLPTIFMRFEILDKDTNQTFQHNGPVYPEKTLPTSRYEKLSEWTRTRIDDIFDFHLRTYPQHSRRTKKIYDLAVDGVPLSHAGIDKMDLVCVRFRGCQIVYLAGIYVHRTGANMSLNSCVEEFIVQAKESNFKLNNVIADAPARAKLKCLKGHAGFCSCDVCLCVGVHEGKMLFSPRTLAYQRRTMQKWLRDVEIVLKEIADGKKPDDAQTFGIQGRSPLLKIDGFDLIENVPIEPMHNLFLGMARQIINEIINPRRCGTDKFSAQTLRLMYEFDQRWLKLRIPSEFTRRPRSMRKGLIHYKSSEYLAITMCGFMSFGRALVGAENQKFRKVWYYFIYLLRSVFFNDEMYRQICRRVNLSELMQTFYFMFENVFGKQKCSFNLHLFSHLRETRKRHRMSEISAEPFESFYGFIKRVLVANTKSFTKQALQKAFIAGVRDHNCERTLKISKKMTRANTQDNMVYTSDREFFEVVDIKDKDTYHCKKIITGKYRNPDVFKLDFSVVGVELFKKYDSEIVEVKKRKIVGKAVRDGRLMIAIPMDALFS